MRADRLLSIVLLLQTHGRMNARQLATDLEVCERTIYRDIEALSTTGVPIYGQAGPDGGYQLMDGYRINLASLSDNELRALFLLNSPDLFERLGLSQDVKTAMLKLTSSLPEARRKQEQRLHQRYWIDAGWWGREEAPVPFMKILQQAVWEEWKLSITYTPVVGVMIEREVEPYGLAAKNGAWYLVFAHSGRMRARRVNELLEVKMCSDKFERNADFDLSDFWKSWCAEDEESYLRYPVKVRVFKAALPVVKRRFGARVSEQIAAAAEDEQGNRIITLFFRWIEDARDRLLPLGNGIEVLEPFALRASMADFAARTARMYGIRLDTTNGSPTG